MTDKKILVVEDEKDIRDLLKFNLEQKGFSVDTAGTGEEALVLVQKNKPDLIVLDIMLPGIDGLEVCRTLSVNEIPIIMVTAKSEDSDIILGLEMGADDYVTKPFSPRVLVARVQAALRRKQKQQAADTQKAVLEHQGVEIDTRKFHVRVDGEAVELTVTEYSILEFFIKNPGWVFSRGQIIQAVKGSDYPVTERSVDVQILGLRKKLGKKSDIIETVRGIGYRMTE